MPTTDDQEGYRHVAWDVRHGKVLGSTHSANESVDGLFLHPYDPVSATDRICEIVDRGPTEDERRGAVADAGHRGPGDSVYTPPGEWNWHGAHPDHRL